MIVQLLIAFVCLLLFHNFYWKRRGLPPGPTPLPVVGNALSFHNVRSWEHKLLEWREKYGNIYTMWLGERPVVTFNSYPLIQKYMINDADSFADRTDIEATMKLMRGGNFGLFDSLGPMWRDQRRFALRVLRDFGLGKNEMQEKIIDEVNYVIDMLDREIDGNLEEVDVQKHFDIAVGSVINSLICGYRFTLEENKSDFYKLKRISIEAMESGTTALAQLAFFNPWVFKVPILNSGGLQAAEKFKEIFGFLDRIIKKHEKEYDYTSEPKDYIDAYLMERHRLQKDGDPNAEVFCNGQLRNACADIWLAGQETTSDTLNWAIAFLIGHPNIQLKVQTELDRVIGSDRMITVADRASLPYTNATIMEVQRCCNLLGFNLLRACSRDVNVEGYHLKKGTAVLPQISVVMIDPKVFEDPLIFNPDRFIENGKLKQCEELIPFSVGKRICLGEGLARMELFLFLANILSRFEFRAGQVPPTMTRHTSNSFNTENYTCCVRRRLNHD